MPVCVAPGTSAPESTVFTATNAMLTSAASAMTNGRTAIEVHPSAVPFILGTTAIDAFAAARMGMTTRSSFDDVGRARLNSGALPLASRKPPAAEPHANFS
eukprot:6185749-Pleurochrysis_carterae.AAC.2